MPSDPDPPAGGDRGALPPHPDGGRRGKARTGRAGARVCTDARLNRHASHGDHSGEALRPREATASGCPRPAAPSGPRQGDAHRRARRGQADAELIERVILVTGERRAERIALRHAQRTTSHWKSCAIPRTPAIPRRPRWGSSAPRRSVPAASPCCPATAPCSTRPSSTRRCSACGRRVTIVPDRHGTGTNALLLSPPDAIAPAFGPDSCARHVDRARRPGTTRDRATRVARARRRHARRSRGNGRGAGATAAARPGNGRRAGAPGPAGGPAPA